MVDGEEGEKSESEKSSFSFAFNTLHVKFIEMNRLLLLSFWIVFLGGIQSLCSAQLDSAEYFEEGLQVEEQELQGRQAPLNSTSSNDDDFSQCWPFCHGVNKSIPSVPEWEGDRYQSIGNLKYVDPLIGTAGSDPKFYNPEYSEY